LNIEKEPGGDLTIKYQQMPESLPPLIVDHTADSLFYEGFVFMESAIVNPKGRTNSNRMPDKSFA
jgi:hypothetical protein